MAISLYPASVTMPEGRKPYPSLLDFLALKFPRIERSCWERRIAEGKVLGEDGLPLTGSTPYLPYKRIFYFREVEQEKPIPFAEEILFQNDDLLVACKPHFLPVTPGGAYVEQCLLHRLRMRTGNDDLVAMHRIDRDTAGIVLFSANRKSRVAYCSLFRKGEVEKSYEAVAAVKDDPGNGTWLVENRLVPGEPWFTMKTEEGTVNARSLIELVEAKEGRGRFVLNPLTGKTHQLRMHLSGLGFGIMNDRLYPELQPQGPDDFDKPLQLIARSVRFRDPVSGEQMEFRSARKLLW